MAQRRGILLIVALIVASLAAVATWMYLGGVQQRAYGNAALVKVLVVKNDVMKGLPAEQALEQGLIGPADMPQKFRPATALTDVNAIRGKMALTNLAAGSVLVEGQFVEPRVAMSSFAQRIPAGQVAVTIQVDPVRGVANLISPGDKVNILSRAGDGIHLLYQNVDVLAVGSSPAPQPGDTTVTTQPSAPTTSNSSGLITFSVPPAAAQKIALAAAVSEGGLQLSLVPPDNPPVPVPVVTPGNLFQGGPTPYGP